MDTWNPAQLDEIAAAQEVEISSLREDGALTKPVTIWAVKVDDELYAAYKEKYGYPSDPVDSITTEEAKATTIRVVPR
jgi:hypothetical protein